MLSNSSESEEPTPEHPAALQRLGIPAVIPDRDGRLGHLRVVHEEDAEPQATSNAMDVATDPADFLGTLNAILELHLTKLLVEATKPGGALRLLADGGEGLLPFLQRLNLDEESAEYVARTVGAMTQGGEGAPATPDMSGLVRNQLVEPLTKRELEILVLIAQRLSNQEIADKLFISPETVKRHLSNMYGKLAVHSRREAVAKAIALGLLKA